jgi:hypothetical protein
MQFNNEKVETLHPIRIGGKKIRLRALDIYFRDEGRSISRSATFKKAIH